MAKYYPAPRPPRRDDLRRRAGAGRGSVSGRGGRNALAEGPAEEPAEEIGTGRPPVDGV